MPGKIRIVLVGTSHPGNVGATARAMKVMGLERLVLVAPACEPGAEARARASGAGDVLRAARTVDSLDEALRGAAFVAATSARARRLGPVQCSVREGATEMHAALEAGDAAVVFGPERTGLDNDAMDRCNRLWRIPTAAGYESLNLAAAVQVVAYELFVAGRGAAPATRPRPAADAADVAALCAHFERAARRVGYIAPDAPRLALRRVQRLARRARLEPSEVKLLRGFLRAAERSRSDAPADPAADT